MYGASEGLATVLIDHGLPGGQAGTSSRIRNYLGFPTGLSGRDLTNRALEQAWFFGARFVLSRRATGLAPAGDGYRMRAPGRKRRSRRGPWSSRTGVTWRRLEVPSLDALLGAGVFYGAALSDAAAVEGARVFIVGAGNSAGQAAVHLAAAGATVTLVVRAASLGCEHVRVPRPRARGNARDHDPTDTPRWSASTAVRTSPASRSVSNDDGSTEDVDADLLYVMIGAHPHTDWLDGALARDEHGYILTGSDAAADTRFAWPLERPPMLLETSLPGVFAAGDVRRGSVKRVASAVGEGSIAGRMLGSMPGNGSADSFAVSMQREGVDDRPAGD